MGRGEKGTEKTTGDVIRQSVLNAGWSRLNNRMCIHECAAGTHSCLLPRTLWLSDSNIDGVLISGSSEWKGDFSSELQCGYSSGPNFIFRQSWFPLMPAYRPDPVPAPSISL
jgi:hypothetical protein